MTPVSKQPARIARMFDAIAGRYDLLNHLLSAGLDRRWRRHAIRRLALSGRERVLDMCTGTGDLAIEAATGPFGRARQIVAMDFSAEMLRHARRKIGVKGLDSRIVVARADATAVPLPGDSFDAATVGFGIRNVLDTAAACREFHRVLRGGGRLAILEFGSPRIPGLRAVYLWYFKRVLPRIGRLLSHHAEAYDYLPASVLEFPTADRFADILRAAGFSTVRYETLAFGIVYLYVATKSELSPLPA